MRSKLNSRRRSGEDKTHAWTSTLKHVLDGWYDVRPLFFSSDVSNTNPFFTRNSKLRIIYFLLKENTWNIYRKNRLMPPRKVFTKPYQNLCSSLHTKFLKVFGSQRHVIFLFFKRAEQRKYGKIAIVSLHKRHVDWRKTQWEKYSVW